MFNLDYINDVIESNSVYIYTHLDVDGLASAALFIRYILNKGFKGDIGVSITQPYYLISEFSFLNENDYVVLLDLGLDKRIIKSLEGKYRKKNRYIAIDHHRRTLDVISDRIFVDGTRSASMIIGDLLDVSGFDKYLARLGGVSDKIVYDEALGVHSVIISSAMRYNINNKWFAYHLLGVMINGKSPYSDDMVKYYAKMMKQIADVVYYQYEDFSKMFKNIKLRIYKNGYNFSSILADKFSQEYPGVPVFVITKVPYKNKILFTARIYNNSDIDLSKLIRKMRRFGGEAGGHRRAASGVVDIKYGEKIMNMLKKFDEGLS